MQVSHSPALVSAAFDDPNLVSCAGLAPVVALAERCGLTDLVAGTLTLPVLGGVNAHLKVPALVAGMVAGADSIEDMDLLRHGGMDRLFGGVRAPRRSGRPCGRSPSGTCGNSTVSRPRCSASSPRMSQVSWNLGGDPL